MESKILKLQKDLQDKINDFWEKELLPKEYITVEIFNGAIKGGDGECKLIPKVKVLLGVNEA